MKSKAVFQRFKNVFNRDITLIRDDLRSLTCSVDEKLVKCPTVTGNKSRKLQGLGDLLLNSKYSDNCRKNIVVSYGGIQSNSMRAISSVTRFANIYLESCRSNESQHIATTKLEYVYFTRKLADHIKALPEGNLNDAIGMGMKVSSKESEIDKLNYLILSYQRL